MQVQVIPQYVNPPKQPGGKYGNIKLQDGTLYMVPAHALANFAPNMVANIEFSVQNWGQPGNQKPFNVVTGVNGVPITGQAGPVRGGDTPAPLPQHVPQSDKEEGMFIMGVVGRAMGSGKFEIGDIPALTKFACQAWKDRHTPYPQEQSHGLQNNPVSGEQAMREPDDEIPF